MFTRIYNLFHPENFQGSFTRRHYFEGWYFKHVSAGGDASFACIPGISTEGDPHAFIQIIDGTGGHTRYFRYPLTECRIAPRQLDVRIGGSHFTPGGITLNIAQGDTRITGELAYTDRTPWPRTAAGPGIMGWYGFVPFMQCKHGVVSIDHTVNGSLNVNGTVTGYAGGRGYIEKDWGSSFPDYWVWLQGNSFRNVRASCMLSVARIPWFGGHFIGFLGFLHTGDTLYRFATYTGAKIDTLSRTDDGAVTMAVRTGQHRLHVTARPGTPGILKAPRRGAMSEHIKESVDAELGVVLKDRNGHTLFSGTSVRCGMEAVEGIFRHFE